MPSSINLAAAGAPNRYPLLEGIRALSVIWLVLFHSIWFTGYFAPPAQYISILRSGLLSYFVLHGHLGVDVFFALSGFLITHVLLELAEQKQSGVLGPFYRRRAFRILPVYFAVALIYVACSSVSTSPPNLGSLWANALLINNYFPVEHQAMAWTWSLAIEEQFYLVFPLLFVYFGATMDPKKPRRLLGVVVILFALAVAVKAFVIFTTGPWTATPVHPYLSGQLFFDYFDVLYCRTHMRIGGILLGIIARLALADTEIRTWFQTHRRAARAALTLALGAVASVVLASLTIAIFKLPEARMKPWLLLLDRYLITAGVAYFMFHALAIPQGGGVLNRFLSSPFWRPFAEVSYAAFLINPIVYGAFGALFRSYFHQPNVLGWGLIAYLVSSVFTVFGLAYALNRWVETPIRRLGRYPLSELAARLVTPRQTGEGSVPAQA